MKKILFTHSYFLHFDKKQEAIGKPYAPLATLYAAALMRENGYEVSLFDTMFSKNADELIDALNAGLPDMLVIYDDGFNYLTKMCLTNMREAAFHMINLAKRCGITVIVSSSDATDHYDQYLQAGADFILIGEGEITLLELSNALASGKNDLHSIPGIVFNENGTNITTGKRNVLKDLDSLPQPAWDLVDIDRYKEMWMRHAGYFSINIATTRGCPFKCNWCAKPIYGNRYNSRSPQKVVEELTYLMDNYGFDHVWFCDDIFGLKPGWVEEFAKLVQKEELSFTFKIQSRADLLLQPAYVSSLQKAGCENAWMGAESGSQKILDAMDKGITVQQIHEATNLLKIYEIKPSLFIQFGYLGETKEDIKMTIKMINELMPHEIGISVSYPLPGTGFYEKVKAAMQEKHNWTDSSELALMFRNTYAPSFYKQLHRYVHNNYKKHIATIKWREWFKRSGKIDVKKMLSAFYYIPATWYDRVRLFSLQHKKA